MAPSASKLKRMQKKAGKDIQFAKSTDTSVDELAAGMVHASIIADLTATGVLTSQPLSRDIKVENFNLSCYGTELIANATLELNFGRRYGLIGANGSGKSTFLKALAAREIPLPEHLDVFLLEEEAKPTDKTALETVVEEAMKEVKRLEQKAEEMMQSQSDNAQEMLEDLYERIDQLDPNSFEATAAALLYGLGFDKEMMAKATKDMSGGWRMRVALARALFVKPTLLLLDEPTNHLDLEACVWLEEYLKRYGRILVVVSHSQDFLNGVCTNIMHLHKKKLKVYTGNYSQYIKTREELETDQMKHYHKQQAEIEHIKKFIASCGTYANLVRQAKSRQKILDKMEADGLVEKVTKEPVFSFQFAECRRLPPPVLSFDEVTFAYSGKVEEALYINLDIGVDLDSRIALVGPNGVGKSTLLKLMCGDLAPINGRVSRHTHLKIGRYHQHSVEQLDMSVNAIAYMRQRFAEKNQGVDYWRTQLGKFGLTGSAQTLEIGKLSDGMRSRVVFAELAFENPNLLLLDEPTNHLDLECIDSLADAIKAYEGGVVLVSHDFRLINQMAKEIWVCENKTIRKWGGNIEDYKEHLKKGMK